MLVWKSCLSSDIRATTSWAGRPAVSWRHVPGAGWHWCSAGGADSVDRRRRRRRRRRVARHVDVIDAPWSAPRRLLTTSRDMSVTSRHVDVIDAAWTAPRRLLTTSPAAHLNSLVVLREVPLIWPRCLTRVDERRSRETYQFYRRHRLCCPDAQLFRAPLPGRASCARVTDARHVRRVRRDVHAMLPAHSHCCML